MPLAMKHRLLETGFALITQPCLTHLVLVMLGARVSADRALASHPGHSPARTFFSIASNCHYSVTRVVYFL